MKMSTMKKRLLTGMVIMGMICVSRAIGIKAAALDKYDIPEHTTQVAFVKYKRNGGTFLRYYEKKENGKWKKRWSCPACVGRNGIGKTREGDGKTPSGVYSLGQAFGIKDNPGTKMPYIKVNRQHYWCGDWYNGTYNKLIRQDKTNHRCRGEHLIQYKGVYNYSIFIEYNKKGVPKKGSAIFLHCSSGRSTAGCVAIPEKYMKKILKRLNPSENPKIIIE